MKVLHVLYQSLPQISGSSIRSRDILMAQKEIGIDVYVIVSPFQSFNKNETCLNGIKYNYTGSYKTTQYSISDRRKHFFKRIGRLLKIVSFTNNINVLIKKEKPDILHAHAMFFCGLPALYLGFKHNLPVVYEFRSLWMFQKERIKKRLLHKIIEFLLLKLEIFIMIKADKLIVINDSLKSYIIDKKVPEEKILVIKNAVNTTLVEDLLEHIPPKTDNLAVFGYIGTLTPHEGIDRLIKCFKELAEEYSQIKLLIYGAGIATPQIRELASGTTNVVYKGTVKPSEIHNAFSAVSVIVNPRCKNKLTDTVTPLKPLEAMAYKKIFLGSDVGGIKELVKDGYNGFLFKAEDPEDLKNKLKKIFLMNIEEREKIIHQASQYIYNHKSWRANAEVYKYCYEKLINERYERNH